VHSLLLLALVQDPGTARAARPTVEIPRIEAQAAVDGVLDEPAWAQAARLTGFRQYQPVDGRPAEEQTDVLVWYSPTAIHFGIIARDRNPGSIRATVADRDDLDQEDRVTIYLDTFNDQRRAFFFGVNPLGAQEDGVRSEGQLSPGQLAAGSTDRNPDYVWQSKGRTTPEGYEVEVRIPFKSLRFRGGGPQDWGLNIVRVTQRTGYEDTWADTRRASSSFLTQSGTLAGLHDLERGIVTELSPFVTASLGGVRDPSTGIFDRGDVDPSAGANLRLGFTNFALDATVNPDFSTVESDEGQVTVNERFALFFPEKRPFFLEGIELFATPNQLVYTRRINDPIAGAKMTGKFGRLATAYLAALDETGEDDALFNIGRLRYDLGSASTGGFTYTDRIAGDAYNRVASADAHIVFARLYFLEGQLGNSWTRDGAGSRNGAIWKAEFDRTGRSWGFNYRLNGIAPDFATQSGFVNRTGIVNGSAFNRLSFYGSRGALIEQFTTFFGVNRLWDYDDFSLGDAIEGDEQINTRYNFRGGWSAAAGLERRFYFFDPASFGGYEVSGPGGPLPFLPAEKVTGQLAVSASVSTPTFQSFSAGVNAGVGEAPIFAEAAEGHGMELGASLTVRPVSSIRATGSVNYFRLARDRDDSEFARAIIPRLKVEFQPARAFFFRFIGEYRAERQAALRNATDGAPILVGGSSDTGRDDNHFRIDWLAAYEPTPGTALYFGYGSTLQDSGALSFSNVRRNDDAFFLKAAYLIRR
jgi:hypothetical protein